MIYKDYCDKYKAWAKFINQKYLKILPIVQLRWHIGSMVLAY